MSDLNNFLKNIPSNSTGKEPDKNPEESKKVAISDIQKSIDVREVEINNSLYIKKSIDGLYDSVSVYVDKNKIRDGVQKCLGDLEIESLSTDIFDTAEPIISIGGLRFNISDIKSVPVEKNKDPYSDYTHGSEKIPATMQFHATGKRYHIDLRLKHGNFLIGWGIFNQKAGVVKEDIDTIAMAKKIASKFSHKSSKYFKSIEGDERVISDKKDKHPLLWFDITQTVFEPGEAGASKNKKGVTYKIDNPIVYSGIHTDDMHEYFIIGKLLKGVLVFRTIADGSDEWVTSFSTDIDPVVLKKSSVKNKVLPPLGNSGLPDTVENDIPEEFRYWKAKTKKEALDIRKNLVNKGIVEKISIVDNKFRLTHKKNYLGVNVKKSLPSENSKLVNFKALEQIFHNPYGRNRSVWWLCIDDPSSDKLFGWTMKSLDFDNEDVFFAEEYIFDSKDLWSTDGKIDPGTRYNTTKNIDCTISEYDQGNCKVTKNGNMLYLDLKGNKVNKSYVAIKEDDSSPYWGFSKKKFKKVNMDGDFLMIDSDDLDIRKQMKPFSFFYPSHPISCTSDINQFFSQVPDSGVVVVDAVDSLVKSNIQCSGENVYMTIYLRDNKVIRYKNTELKDFYQEVLSFSEGVDGLVFDGYISIVDEDGYSECESYTEEIISHGELFDHNYVFRILNTMYLDGKNHLEDKYINTKKIVSDYYKSKNGDKSFKRIELSPYDIHTYKNIKELHNKLLPLIDDKFISYIILKTPDCKQSVSGIGCGICFSKYKTYCGNIISKQKKRGRRKNDSDEEWVYEVGISVDSTSKEFNNKTVINEKEYVTVGKSISSLDLSIKDKVLMRVEDVDYNPISNSLDCGSIKILCKSLYQEETNFLDLYESIDRSKVVKSLINFMPNDMQFEQCSKSMDSSGSEERYVLGIVLEPEKIDGQNEVVGKEEIRNACHNFMEFYQELGFYHLESNFDRVRILENYIAPADFTVNDRVIKEGTWLMGIRVVDDESWQKIKNNEINGLSIFGNAKKFVDSKSNDFSKVG